MPLVSGAPNTDPSCGLVLVRIIVPGLIVMRGSHALNPLAMAHSCERDLSRSPSLHLVSLVSYFGAPKQCPFPPENLEIFPCDEKSQAVCDFFCEFSRKNASPLRFGWRRGPLRQKIAAICDCDFWCSQFRVGGIDHLIAWPSL